MLWWSNNVWSTSVYWRGDSISIHCSVHQQSKAFQFAVKPPFCFLNHMQLCFFSKHYPLCNRLLDKLFFTCPFPLHNKSHRLQFTHDYSWANIWLFTTLFATTRQCNIIFFRQYSWPTKGYPTAREIQAEKEKDRTVGCIYSHWQYIYW